MKLNTYQPSSWLGLLGGGQLGRMFAQAAATLGYRVCVLEPDKNAPAATVCERHLCYSYTDPKAHDELGQLCCAITTEFENVPAETLKTLANYGRTCPNAHSVSITQDRFSEKEFISSIGVPVAPYVLIESEQDCEKVGPDHFPAILKTARLGYDGKGQISVSQPSDLKKAFETLGKVRCVLEKKLVLVREISVIAVRNPQGEIKTFPVCENHHRNGILAYTVMPARIGDDLANKARTIASHIVDQLDYTGVLCTELFVLDHDELVVNELAPRPHNSGHATIEACISSQYDQQVRAMCGMPLGNTDQICFAVMINLLGDIWFDENDQIQTPDWSQILKLTNTKLHLYGKHQPRKARKMGHVTCLGNTAEEAMETANTVCKLLNLPLLK